MKTKYLIDYEVFEENDVETQVMVGFGEEETDGCNRVVVTVVFDTIETITSIDVNIRLFNQSMVDAMIDGLQAISDILLPFCDVKEFCYELEKMGAYKL